MISFFVDYQGNEIAKNSATGLILKKRDNLTEFGNYFAGGVR